MALQAVFVFKGYKDSLRANRDKLYLRVLCRDKCRYEPNCIGNW